MGILEKFFKTGFFGMSVKGWITLAVLFVVSIFAYDFLTKKPKRVLPPAMYKEDYTTWKEFLAEDGSFSVKFPGAPQHATATEDAPFGVAKDKVTYHVYASQGKDGTTFLVKEIQYPDTAPLGQEEVLFDDIVRDMITNNANSKLIESKKGSFLNRPTRDFEIEAPGFLIRSRAFFAGKKLFVLTVMDRNPIHINDDFNTFVDSFQLR